MQFADKVLVLISEAFVYHNYLIELVECVNTIVIGQRDNLIDLTNYRCVKLSTIYRKND